MKPTRVLVVDDEALARSRLIRLLQDIPDIEVVGEAEDGRSALAAIDRLAPDVVFLDICMPGLDGMALAQSWMLLPPIVFCTGYDEHAVAAFEVNAVDFLLKPVRPHRLAVAVERVRSRCAGSGAAALRAVSETVSPRIVSNTRGEIRFFDAREVTRFWAAEKYTLFRCDGAEQLTEESLTSLEQRLESFGFLRIHRGELIRISAVRTFRELDGYAEVLLSDDQRARVSRRSISVVKARLARG
jgi:DNA-binding LytR/AlgR family response regulator